MGFLRTILILILIYYLWKMVSIYILKNVVKSNTKTTRDHRRSYNKKEGEITIDYIPEKKKKISRDKGEYIDYEEIQE
jgi:hypothetical protein